MGRGKYLFKNTIIFTLGNLGSRFITFFLIPLYTNMLTASEYGVVDLINVIVTLVAPILILNVHEAIMRFGLDDNADTGQILGTALVCLAGGTVLATLVTGTVACSAVAKTYIAEVFLYVLSLMMSLVFLSNLRGKEMLFRYAIGNILHTLSLALLNIFFLVYLKLGIKGYLLAYTVSNFISAVYGFFAGKVWLDIIHFKWNTDLSKSMLKYSIVLIPNNFMWWIMNSSDRVMVSSMIDSAASGLYAVAYKLPTLLSTCSSIFNIAWSYSAIHEKGSEDNVKYQNTIYDGLVSFIVIIASGLLMVIKLIMKFYVSSEFYIAWRYTPWLIVGFVFMTLGSFVATAYTVEKNSKGFLFSGIAGAVINIILNFLFIPHLGVTGAALATCISYLTVFVYRVLDTRKYINLNVFQKKHLMGYIVLLISIFTLFIDNVLGQILLVIEFVITLIIFKEFVILIVKSVCKKVLHNK